MMMMKWFVNHMYFGTVLVTLIKQIISGGADGVRGFEFPTLQLLTLLRKGVGGEIDTIFVCSVSFTLYFDLCAPNQAVD